MVDFKANLMSKSREIAQIHQKTEIENRTKIKNVISTMDGYLFGLPIRPSEYLVLALTHSLVLRDAITRFDRRV